MLDWTIKELLILLLFASPFLLYIHNAIKLGKMIFNNDEIDREVKSAFLDLMWITMAIIILVIAIFVTISR